MSKPNDVAPSSPQKAEAPDPVDSLHKQAGKYIPPHERARLAAAHNQQGTQTPPPQASPSPNRGKWAGDRPALTESGSKWGDRGDPRDNRGQGDSRGSFGFGRESGGYPERGGKWSDRPSGGGHQTYGSDGLMPANPRVEAELFPKDKVSSGINFSNYEDIQVFLDGEDIPEPLTSYTDVDLGPVLEHNIKLATFSTPTPIQKNAIPVVLAGRDLLACAQTGSGKTAAFLFPIIADLVSQETHKSPVFSSPSERNRYKVFPEALVLAPTRELAIQIHTEARKFTYRSHLRSCVVYGGAELRNQLSDLERGCNILVATPGRLLDMITRGKVSIKNIKYLCIDEADRMLDMGFEVQVRDIIAECPGSDMRRTLMFSATFPKTIQRLAEDFLNNYIFLRVGRLGSTTEAITQKVRWIEDHQKKDALVNLLTDVEGLTLVFCETKRMADHLEDFLYSRGFKAASIHGDRTQREREAALEAFKTSAVQILVATDVASRGLDVQGVKHVINFDLPHDIDDYTHRIGRTGRAGHTGLATAFFNDKNSGLARDLVDLIEDSGHEAEGWLVEIAQRYSNRGSRPTRGRGGGGAGGGRPGGRGGGYEPRTEPRMETRVDARPEPSRTDHARAKPVGSLPPKSYVFGQQNNSGGNYSKDDWW